MAGINRLQELHGVTNFQPTAVAAPAGADLDDVKEHYQLYEPIKRMIKNIQTNVVRIHELKNKDMQTASDKSRKEIVEQLKTIMSQTTQWSNRINRTLEEIKEENGEFRNEHPNSARNQMRQNLYSSHLKQFSQVMLDYNGASQDFKAALQNRTKRQLKIVDPTISDEDMTKIVESGKAQDVIRTALVSENLKDVVKAIEERHLDILKLEQQVLEVHELFKDLAQLVDIQQESLDVIETRILHAKDYTETAELELVDAEAYQNKARRRKCFFLVCILILLVVILAPIIATSQKESE